MKQKKKLKISCGKKLRKVKEKLDDIKSYTLNDAVQFLQDNSFTKFDETLEIALKLGINLEQSDQNIRGAVNLPHGIGKKIRVAAFVKDENIDLAKKAGADLVGLEDLIEEVKKGKIDFDACVATPDIMAKISVIAKVLGPKGLMPNPKLGTVTKDVAEAIKRLKSGQVEFRTDKAGIIHAGVGKLSFKKQALVDNIKALIDTILKAKPSGLKGTYFQKLFVTSTMGPSLKLELSEFTTR
ncbi:MAG: 50S ribosomal protein L1 [Rickettsiales bacterium]|nr:50S ribosomal protein L1 [Rickettsiales bacterium]